MTVGAYDEPIKGPIYITKYAVTQGIIELPSGFGKPGGSFWERPGSMYSHHCRGGEWFTDREAAVADAKRRIQKAIESAKRKIKKLEEKLKGLG